MEALIRESKRKALSFIHNVQATIDRKRVNAILENYSTSVIENEPPKQIKTIMFVITRMVRFHGGQTSVLRLGTELSKLGYSVYYAVYKNQSKEEMQICASSNLAGFEGTLISSAAFKKLQSKKSPDVIVATSWDTVSFQRNSLVIKCILYRIMNLIFIPLASCFYLQKRPMNKDYIWLVWEIGIKI